jgi:hypothetical protein
MASGTSAVAAGEGLAIMGKLPQYRGTVAGVGARPVATVQQTGNGWPLQDPFALVCWGDWYT